MYTTTFIRRHIFRLPVGRLFTSREFLLYGTRAAVDQALSRLVRKGLIVRLARGVFIRQDSDVRRISPIDVARAKAESFGKQLAVWGGHLASKLGLVAEGPPEQIFSINGSSSSFKFGKITVYLRKVCARKMRLSTSQAGVVLSSLWHLGRAQVSHGQVRLATRKCLRPDLEEIRLSLVWLPAWLSAHFLARTIPYAAFKNFPCQLSAEAPASA